MAELRKIAQSFGFALSFNLIPEQMLWCAWFYVNFEILKDFLTEFPMCARFRAHVGTDGVSLLCKGQFGVKLSAR